LLLLLTFLILQGDKVCVSFVLFIPCIVDNQITIFSLFNVYMDF
jgi:hypothetical protein